MISRDLATGARVAPLRAQKNARGHCHERFLF
jgi:hypothetical protein